MPGGRHLEWGGCVNVRDLGGIPAIGGGQIVPGAVVRGGNPARLTSIGWDQLVAHGVRTVVLLRTEGTSDVDPDPAVVPPGVRVLRVVLEDATDPDFQRRCVEGDTWATPLQWIEMLEGWPERCAAAVRAVAQAEPGGVLISCGLGRDRTGLLAFLLLALVGVSAAAIGDDWSLSHRELVVEQVASGIDPVEVLARRGTTVLGAVRRAVDLDVEDRLLQGGLARDDLHAVRRRLLG